MKRLWACILPLAAAGCGYHLSGNADTMPKSVKTIAIVMRNGTSRYDIARMLPADIAREMISRTRYRVIDDVNQADAVLEAGVITLTIFPTTADSTLGRSTGAEAELNMGVKLTERSTGKVLFNRPSYRIQERYEISENPQTYFDESGPAAQRLSRDAARSLVSAILEAF